MSEALSPWFVVELATGGRSALLPHGLTRPFRVRSTLFALKKRARIRVAIPDAIAIGIEPIAGPAVWQQRGAAQT